MRVQVMLLDLDGKLPAGQKLESKIGQMLIGGTTSLGGQGIEKLTPMNYLGSSWVTVCADPADKTRMVNLVLAGADRLGLGPDDELVVQQCQVDAFGLHELLGTASEGGVKLSASPQPVLEMMRLIC